ncbi:MATE family efflux transporter [Streptomyces macrosporus]|uniref:Probable multidrug resistance protein NorM n=1 Tax=Streptomyces macrosporus TaxID=44032 RepID=A0ABP5XPS9_9ACTN
MAATDGIGQSDKPKARRIASAALPLYLTMIASSAAGIVDASVLGRYGTVSLAAFAVTMAVFSPAVAAVAGAMRGLMPFVAANDEDADALVPVVRNGMWLGICTGSVAALCVLAVPLIALLMGVPAATREGLGAFPALLAAAVLVTAVGTSATTTLVGLGRGKLVMRAGMAGTAAAVVLSLVLVGGVGGFTGLGLPGAGVAMLASSLISATLAHRALRRSTVLAGHSLRPGPLDLRAVFKIARVGIPLAATVLIKFAVLGVLAMAVARVDTDSTAVHSISITLVNFMFTAAAATGQATVPIAAKDAGAGDGAGLRSTVLTGLGVAFGAVVLLCVVLAVARGPLLSLFTHDGDLRTQIVAILPLVFVVVVTDGIQALFGFGLIAIKRTVPSLAVFAVVYGLLAVAAIPVAAAGGLAALWGALAGANMLLVAGQSFFFFRNSRQSAALGGVAAA